MNQRMALCAAALLVAAAGAAHPHNLVANPSLERGVGGAPNGWRLVGAGTWAQGVAHSGRYCLAVSGDGTTSAYWRCDLALGAGQPGAAPQQVLALKPNTTYLVSFWVRGEAARGGCVISGPDFANRDYGVPAQWTYHESVFVTPGAGEHYLRFGQWMVSGTVYFDDIALREVAPVHRSGAGVQLGSGERISAGRYHAAPIGEYAGGNYHRGLDSFNAAWNTNRWRMGEGNFVTYRHDLGAVRQRAAQVGVSLGFYQSGACLVEASRDGRDFVPVGEVREESRRLPLPAELFPASVIFVRLSASRAAKREGDSAPGSFQITDYVYEAEVDRALSEVSGHTAFLQIMKRAADPVVTVESLGGLSPAAANEIRLALETKMPREVEVSARIGPAVSSKRLRLAAGRAVVRLPYSLERAGTFPLILSVSDGRGHVVYEARAKVTVPILAAADYGELLASDPLPLWWCGATYKVSIDRPLPRARGRVVRIGAARNEYEPFQLVLRCERALRNVSVEATPLRGPGGAEIAAPVVRLVGYVNIVHPTDELGVPGLWPDPLPRYAGPFALGAGRNQPLWLTVYVPRDARAGIYRGAVTISADGYSVSAPIALKVWDFTLPQVPTIRSGFGFSEQWVARYENLSGEALAATIDKYYRAFQSHRIAPYNPMGAPRVNFADGKVAFDWTEFDRKAAYYLDELGFNSFTMPVMGLGGGTFHSAEAAEIAGTRAGTPEYRSIMAQYLGGIQQHLEEKGWLEKAYVYWFDEPSAEQYEYVRGGLETLREFAPKLARFLTEHPVEPLFGAVNIWCVPVGAYDETTCRERQRAGDEIWWYLCCGPHAPFVGLFIDHPAVDFRAWLWMSHKYGVTGILIWHTNWWTSPTAFPEPQLQNPYEDPMSYVSGYGVAPGTRQFWGNGDGRLWYPTSRNPGQDQTPYLDGPVPSMRVELLREGIEDYEYFQLLKRLAERHSTPAATREKAAALLEIPQAIITDLTHYNFDPEPMMRHRARMAAMIERLSRAGETGGE